MLDMKTLLLLAGYIAEKYNKYKLLLHLDKTNLFSNNLLLDFKLSQWGELCRERRVYKSELSEERTKRPVRREEKIVNELINIEKLKCQTEVITPHGRIDILTDDEIIEVKQFNKYKDAIGQMIAYSYYYPDRKKRIHLFGKGTEQQLTEIKSLTDPLNIIITTHN